MSELRSALEGFRSDVLSELPDARVEEDFIELWQTKEALEAECLRRLPDLEQRGVFERDGCLSAVSWLASRFKLAWGAGAGFVQMARGLEHMPATRAAMEAGELSVSAAKVLVSSRDVDPEAFGDAEGALVEAARIHSLSDLGKVAAYWRQAVEREHGLDGEEKLREQRRLHLSMTFLNMVKMDGLCDPESGDVILTAVNAVLDDEAKHRTPDDLRTPSQRRLDAMVEVCRQFLDRSDRPMVGGERPHVTVTVSAEMLMQSAGEVSTKPVVPVEIRTVFPERLCELDLGGPVSAETARRLACDASVRRVVMAGASEPLDVGRQTRVISPALRRAVILRDRHCQVPGCYRPARWCDVHHIKHWADGGETSLANTTLLCRRHHRMIHLGQFRMSLEDGRPLFRRPDGSVLERAPP